MGLGGGCKIREGRYWKVAAHVQKRERHRDKRERERKGELLQKQICNHVPLDKKYARRNHLLTTASFP